MVWCLVVVLVLLLLGAAPAGATAGVILGSFAQGAL